MSDQRKCKDCRYWKNGMGAMRCGKDAGFCHHMLDTGKRRVEKDGICASYKRRGKSDGRKEFLFA